MFTGEILSCRIPAPRWKVDRLPNSSQESTRETDALTNADALIVVTDWNEYRHPDFSRVKEALRRPVIIDGRNLYDPEKMREHGLRYYSIGRTVVEQAAPARVGEYA